VTKEMGDKKEVTKRIPASQVPVSEATPPDVLMQRRRDQGRK